MYLILFLSLTILVILVLYLIFCPGRYINPKKIYDLDKAIPGPTGLPIIGNAFQICKLKQEDLFDYLEYLWSLHPRFIKLWVAGVPLIILKDPEDLEVAMSSSLHIKKGLEYHYIDPWLNEGLLLSTGEKWRRRRKQLTPTFHFKILEDNLGSINKHSKEMVRNILNKSGGIFDVSEITHLCTLDIICETAMGINLKDRGDDGRKYINAIEKLAVYTVKRSLQFWLFRITIFNLTSLATKFYEQLKILHSFTDKVIKERKQNYLEYKHSAEKRKRAFLDSMIEMENKHPGSFTDSDIREEVDTFMFEGHDTTSVALNYAFYELGRNEEVQEKAYQEQFEIFGDSDRDVDMNDLTKMTYLEQVIKETLRLHPSVPYLSRFLEHDLKLKDVVTKDANLLIIPFALHRDPKLYPDPLVFDPDRFAPDECKKRHPFAYIPFSAGPRNCIGQRFAMMELKIILSYILRSTKLETITKPGDFKHLFSIVLRTTTPLKVKATQRVS